MHLFDTWVELVLRIACAALIVVLLFAAILYITLGSSFFDLIPARIAGWFLLTGAIVIGFFLALVILKAILVFALGVIWPDTHTWGGNLLAIVTFAVVVIVLVKVCMGGDAEAWKQGIGTAFEEMLAFLNK